MTLVSIEICIVHGLSDPCKPGFTRIGQWCFSIHTDLATRNDSVAICERLGGGMVVLGICKDFLQYGTKSKKYRHFTNNKIPVGSLPEDRANLTTPAGFTIALYSIICRHRQCSN
uniref:C-type lectin domain-containing protein n=1 Tax=Magallana gigas TaxID=29159 RepID=K1Q758_MAGGI